MKKEVLIADALVVVLSQLQVEKETAGAAQKWVESLEALSTPACQFLVTVGETPFVGEQTSHWEADLMLVVPLLVRGSSQPLVVSSC